MDSISFYKEILTYCKQNANAENIKKSQRYFKEEFKGYGLTTTQLREIVKEIAARKDLELATVIETTPKLLKDEMYEEISIGLLLIDNFPKQFTRSTFESISGFFDIGITNWAHTDVLGMYILPKFFAQNIVEINDFTEWLKSPRKFKRRCVPVTFIKPMKASKKTVPFRTAVESLMNDTEREVHQGMGWFLREAWKIERKETESFLEKWKDTAPRLIMQYACEKMTADEKKRFKRQK